MEKNNFEIEIKKVLLSGLQSPDHSIDHIIIDILQNLLLLHSESLTDLSYIKAAAQYVLAYLQLGLSYQEHKELFDSVLQTSGFSSEHIARLQASNPVIIANKQQIRSIIGRWPVSPHNSHTITSAIHDIICHVKNRDLGTYNYYTAKKDGTCTALYQLIISTDNILFHDVFMNRFYNLTEK